MSDEFDPEFRAALCKTYADLLRRQRTAATPFARWSRATKREHEFVWLGPAIDDVPLLGKAKAFKVSPSDSLWEAVHKMYGTAMLNPYEREILFGYPYVVGRLESTTIRGPLLTMAVAITPVGNQLEVSIVDDVLRFNSLPFRTEGDTDAHNLALNRILEETPELPLDASSMRDFVAMLTRELPTVEVHATLDGSLGAVPTEPRSRQALRIIDQAALFVAPKTNYFLRSDLDEIAGTEGGCGALAPLILGAGEEATVDISNEQIDAARIVFPFPSNRAQRRVALMAEDPTTRIISVEGPPGTGKSLTIANLACHLASSGKKVLITSQKGKALEVVDELLRSLDLAELPMTLLRRDKESKAELLGRLDRVEKRRTTDEVNNHYDALLVTLENETMSQIADAQAYATAVVCESEIESADRAAKLATGLRRLGARHKLRSTLRRAAKAAPATADVVAERSSRRRDALLEHATGVLQVGLERGVAGADRSERRVVRELQSVLKRNQATYKNFSTFDRMKKDLDHARKLLRILPVWILSPDDVARLFPCTPELFDVVIVDEASQVDLPSLVPMAYRGAKLVVVGDTKQMQSQRFAFMSQNLAVEAWQQFGMTRFDPDERLHPVKESLLNLVSVQAEESCLLDEHFRSLPPIIKFSNHRWYGDQLRIMTDVHHKRFGAPDQPVIELHFVEEGRISGGKQENELEAKYLVEHLANMVTDPDYDGATIGVLCLFEEQVALVNEMVTDAIDPSEWEEHQIVVVNPDGFQGDERDVILYSLSWDNDVMARAALSARQMETEHIRGMLNVAFTRARDEIHVFHSAPIDTFTMAGDRPGIIADWLAHCAQVQAGGGQRQSHRAGKVDSEFEADVAEALRARGIDVRHQYPACGFSIDLVCEFDGNRLAVECDGEIFHHDEHGNLRMEDIERQAVLERAGWTVLRIPYRKWRADPTVQVQRIIEALAELTTEEDEADDESPRDATTEQLRPLPSPPTVNGKTHSVSADQGAMMAALKEGHRDEESVLRAARVELGYQRLGPRIRERLLVAARQLTQLGLIAIEDGEYFLTPEGRSAELRITPAAQAKKTSRTSKRSSSPHRRRSGYRSGGYRRY